MTEIEVAVIGGSGLYDVDGLEDVEEHRIKKPFGESAGINYIAAFADGVYNPGPKSDGAGYLFGIKFGDKKVKKQGQWQMKTLYRAMERDAWLDILPDSDAYQGMTGMKGVEFVLKYGIAKNVILGIDYYRSELLHSGMKENLFQVDMVYKF